ncbi:hypothetical protein LINPERHAP1_LOCUS16802 [Linum perenne]
MPADQHSAIFLRVLLIIFIGITSLWANHEASKGFQVQILNDASDSPAGKRFSLFYISNGRATSILVNASNFVEHLVGTHPSHRNQIRRVTLQLSAGAPTVETAGDGEFVIRLSPALMLGPAGSRDSAVKSAIFRGMAFVWLRESRAPSWVIEAAVECVNRIAGFGGGGDVLELLPSEIGDHRRRICWGETTDVTVVAGLMEYCERRKEGFLRRLNHELMNGWNDRTTVERAAAMPVEKICESYKNSASDVDL